MRASVALLLCAGCVVHHVHTPEVKLAAHHEAPIELRAAVVLRPQFLEQVSTVARMGFIVRERFQVATGAALGPALERACTETFTRCERVSGDAFPEGADVVIEPFDVRLFSFDDEDERVWKLVSTLMVTRADRRTTLYTQEDRVPVGSSAWHWWFGRLVVDQLVDVVPGDLLERAVAKFRAELRADLLRAPGAATPKLSVDAGDINRVLLRSLRTLDRCFGEQHGSLRFAGWVAPSGSVTGLLVTAEPDDDGVARCASEVIETWAFPAYPEQSERFERTIGF